MDNGCIFFTTQQGFTKPQNPDLRRHIPIPLFPVIDNNMHETRVCGAQAFRAWNVLFRLLLIPCQTSHMLAVADCETGLSLTALVPIGRKSRICDFAWDAFGQLA